MSKQDQTGEGAGGGAATDEETDTEVYGKTGYHKRYKVLLHNDDKTSMQCVVDILMMFFNKEFDESKKLMMTVHETGFGLAGVYSKEQAEFRIEQSQSYARGGGFPLSLSMEPE